MSPSPPYIAFDVDETYSFLKRILVEVIMLLTVGALFIVAVAAGPILNFLTNTLQVLPLNQGFLFTLLIDVVPVLLLFLSFFLIYLYVPRRRVDWEAALPGAVLATLLFVVARPLFTTYIRNFGNYNLIYGKERSPTRPKS
ncbi:MAG TPA: YihY/virulence factor BrkB family protein [Anaerolineae bacterium]